MPEAVRGRNGGTLYAARAGDVLNPRGINGWTYRDEAEKHLQEWCSQYGRDAVRVVADAARNGEPWAAKLLWDRVLPAVSRLEHDVSGSDLPGLVNGLASIASRKRTNGSGNGADHSAEDGTG